METTTTWNVEDLTAWITHQLDLDENATRKAIPGPWSASDGGVIAADYLADGKHIAAWDPARVLAEIAAKRAILHLHFSWWYIHPHGACATCYPRHTSATIKSDRITLWPCPTIAALTLPYRHRPGWNTAWANDEDFA